MADASRHFRALTGSIEKLTTELAGARTTVARRQDIVATIGGADEMLEHDDRIRARLDRHAIGVDRPHGDRHRAVHAVQLDPGGLQL